MSTCYRYQNGKLLLDLHLQTASKTNAIGALYGNRLRIRINAQPIEGKANKQLIAYLAKEFEVKKSDVVILSGLHSRDKTVSINHCREYPAWLSMLGDIKPGERNSVNK